VKRAWCSNRVALGGQGALRTFHSACGRRVPANVGSCSPSFSCQDLSHAIGATTQEPALSLIVCQRDARCSMEVFPLGWASWPPACFPLRLIKKTRGLATFAFRTAQVQFVCVPICPHSP